MQEIDSTNQAAAGARLKLQSADATPTTIKEGKEEDSTSQHAGQRRVLMQKRSQAKGMPYTGSNYNSNANANQVSSQKSLKSGTQDGKRLPSEP